MAPVLLRCALARNYASVTSRGVSLMQTSPPYQLFDRHAKLLQRDRAALKDDGAASRQVDYVREEAANQMLERFLDIKRTFNTVLDIGAGPGHFSRLLPPGSVNQVKMVDISYSVLHRDPMTDFEVHVSRQQLDEESLLSVVPANSQDAVVSCLNLHWVNDLPGVLVQIKKALKPDGVFLAAMFGGDTLFELRTSLQLAEVEREGGISPRVSPMTSTGDMSGLLGRAGFTLLTVDIEEIRVEYPTMWELVHDLQDMGESNAVLDRRHFIHRDTLLAATSIYQNLYATKKGTIPATFQIIHMIGWTPTPNQRKPLTRGSADTNLKDIL
ncbi:S-adenosyl-L-methionine-dependent methyltransferase [Cantharellus anzutake]|uniref:S-adenosyl-L-methionine-dependent methyltransferase n=1 Tax=Cantharellus anzutake TaxID=1750568 RepID=UPI001907ECEB|nr:S-adenosyl-L-methionine-dependent methyltransferase [Cantharellus anzutake]KAF8335034.1 S-adenosyl-L-methionine-dependent methyltransferase [Cantharellus anzutake]